MWVDVLYWIDHVWSSIECVWCACGPSERLDAPSIGFVFVCRKLSPHLRVRELDHRCLLSLCCFFVCFGILCVRVRACNCYASYILSVYSPVADRVGLPLYNIHIPSPFTSIMDIFFVDVKFGHIRFYTL